MRNTAASPRVALLIDAENVQPTYLVQILEIAHRYGKLEICRAYGDWKKPPLRSHLACVQGFQIEIRQVDHVAKDAADKRLMREARKILGQGNVDIFVVATGDGGFRSLCKQIKQNDQTVIGIGIKGQTSRRLSESCDEFHTIEHLEKGQVIDRDFRRVVL